MRQCICVASIRANNTHIRGESHVTLYPSISTRTPNTCQIYTQRRTSRRTAPVDFASIDDDVLTDDKDNCATRMVKRESVGTVDIDAPRPKRRKDSSAAPKSEDVEMADAGASSDVEASDDKKAEDVSRTPEEISEIGLKAWLVVKDASAKE